MTPELETERRALGAALRAGDTSDTCVIRAIEVARQSWPADFAELCGDALLAEMLQSFPIGPVWFERRMTELRRRLLFSPATPGASPVLAALATQCHLNEYAWADTPEEAEAVAGLVDGRGDLTPEQVMAVACYRPLAGLPLADRALAQGWTGPAAEVLLEQVVAVREEIAIAGGLPSLTPIRGGVSEAVRAQYEANPYPRWRRVARRPATAEIAGRPAPRSPRVLVAGCGTGRHAILAAQYLGASRTLAVDLSRRSLAYGVRKSREMGLAGLDFAHADILELPDRLAETFDIVSSIGVLHHMADPFEGVRAACRLLKPGGLLNLGLYSATARAPLRPAKALARSYAADEVRALRQAIIAAPPGDPVRYPETARDFYATSSCRDLIMHVQEHELGFADLRRILSENRLRFLGFVQFDQVVEAYRQAFPNDPEGRDLGAWEAFEAANPLTFGRMYQFWAEKLD